MSSAIKIKALKCKPSAPYASVVSIKQICIVHVYYATEICPIIEQAPRVWLLSCALPVSVRALTAETVELEAKEKTVVCFVKCAPSTDVVA